MSQQEKSVSGPRVQAICGAVHKGTPRALEPQQWLELHRRARAALIGATGILEDAVREATPYDACVVSPDVCTAIQCLAKSAFDVFAEIGIAIEPHSRPLHELLTDDALWRWLRAIRVIADRCSFEGGYANGMTEVEAQMLLDLVERALEHTDVVEEELANLAQLEAA